MATISQFQQALKYKSRQLLIEQSIGRELIHKIELAGGKWQIKDGVDNYFSDVPVELQSELDAKLQYAQERLHDMDQQWHSLLR